ncbi:type III pantothenate kinase [Pelagibacterales bacterium SAG-MED05]|nr:type III pantothenate kinase [Pelagibacterales bacterium SAG-MED05]
MNYIVGDIGNTSTRICLLNKKFSIIKSVIFDTKKIFKKKYFKNILKKFLNENLNPKFLFSSVVPLALKEIKKNFKNSKYKILEIKNLNIKKIIKINVKKINQIGSDRIVNAIGGKKYKNCLILDFGTATTFDIIIDGVYEGGVIAPGIKLSMMNLSNSTALLPMFSLKNNQKNYGKNTKDALNAGFIWGYEGLINNIIDKITSKRKIKYKLILTGGYANFFKKIIKKKATVDQNITIKGISKVYKELI